MLGPERVICFRHREQGRIQILHIVRGVGREGGRFSWLGLVERGWEERQVV